MKSLIQLQRLALLAIFLLMTEPVFAGPGGMIAKVVWSSFWGKVLVILLALIFLPLIIWSFIDEYRSEKRSRRDLAYMASHHPAFQWLPLRERIQDCFYRIHVAWHHQHTDQAADCMTLWYQQNQQQVYLDRWAEQGLVNHCDIKRICTIKPILFVHRNQGTDHQNSALVVSVTARMKDYLADKESGKVVEGDKKFKEVETIWTLVLEDDSWKVSNIEEASTLFDYLKLRNQLPEIESTLSKQFKA
ncbi:MAG: TIM44-like domain-containing protein [Motiliproteus sp.]